MAEPAEPHPAPDYECALDATALAEVVGELVSGDPGSLTDGELSDALVALNRLGSMVDAAAAEYAARWDAKKIWTSDAARSGGSWLAAHTEWSNHQAHRTIAVGRDLRACPHVEAAYRAGLIGTAKVDLLLKVRKGLEEIFADHEAMIIDDIRDRTVRATGDRLRHWRRIASQTVKGDGDSGPEPPDTTDTVHLSSTLDGRWVLDGDLSPVDGETLHGALEAEVDRMFKAGAFTKDDGLSASQRRSKALMELVCRGAIPVNKHGQARPLVIAFCDTADLAGIPIDDPDQVDQRRCELASGVPIGRETLQRLVCEGSVAWVTGQRRGDGSAAIADAVSPSRTATAAQRRALRVRDEGCRFPGCDADVNWCDAHHVVFYENDGPTTLSNLVLLCRFHHHRVHEGGFRLTRDDHDGTVHVWRPDGSKLPSVSRGRQLPLDPESEEAAEDGGQPGLPGLEPTEPLTSEAARDPGSGGPPSAGPPPPTRFRLLAERRTRAERKREQFHRITLTCLEIERRRLAG